MPGSKNVRTRASWLPALIALSFIVLGSTDYLTGHEILVRIDAQVEGVAGPSEWAYPTLKKLCHLAVFFGAGLTLFPLRRRGYGQRLAVILVAAVSLCSEIIQAFSVTRLPSVFDVVINLCAGLTGCYPLFNPPSFVLAGWERLPWRRPRAAFTPAGRLYPPEFLPQTPAVLLSVSKQPRRATEARP